MQSSEYEIKIETNFHTAIKIIQEKYFEKPVVGA